MARALPLYKMTPGAQLNGTVLTHEAFRGIEVTQRIKDTMMMKDIDFVFPIPRHPMMRQDMGFVELVSLFLFSSPCDPLTLSFDSERARIGRQASSFMTPLRRCQSTRP